MNKILMRVETICKQKKVSRYRLAKSTDTPYTTISNAFHNDTMPTISTLEKLCEGLDITMAQFFAEEGEFPNLTDRQRQFLNILSKLPEEKQEKAMAYLEGLAEK